MLTEWHTEGSKTIPERHTGLNAKPPYQTPTKWLPRNKRIFYRDCLPRWPEGSRPRTHWSHYPNDIYGEAVHWDPTRCRIDRCGIRICRAAFREQMRAPITVSMTTQSEANVIYGSMTYRPCLMRLAHSTTLKSSPASHMRTDGYDDAKGEGSHHCPKSRQGAVAIDIEIESIGTPHTTAEQVRIVTGQRAMQKDDRSRRKIVCRCSESRTKLRIESPINPNINSEIEVTLLPTANAKRQSIWWWSRRRSNEFSEEGDSRVYTIKSYRQVKSPPGGGLPRHAPTSLPKSPTDKSISTGWSPKRTSNDDYHGKQHLGVNAEYRGLPAATYSAHAEALHRARTAQARLNLVRITIVEKLTC